MLLGAVLLTALLAAGVTLTWAGLDPAVAATVTGRASARRRGGRSIDGQVVAVDRVEPGVRSCGVGHRAFVGVGNRKLPIGRGISSSSG